MANKLGQPPLITELISDNNKVSLSWAIWFRDLYNRVGYTGNNELDKLIDQVAKNTDDISTNADAISTNADDISANADAIADIKGSPIATTEETVMLTDGQTVVTFTNTDREFYLNGQDVDRGKLFVGEDYTVTSSTVITLTESYPAGATVTAIKRNVP